MRRAGLWAAALMLGWLGAAGVIGGVLFMSAPMDARPPLSNAATFWVAMGWVTCWAVGGLLLWLAIQLGLLAASAAYRDKQEQQR